MGLWNISCIVFENTKTVYIFSKVSYLKHVYSATITMSMNLVKPVFPTAVHIVFSTLLYSIYSSVPVIVYIIKENIFQNFSSDSHWEIYSVFFSLVEARCESDQHKLFHLIFHNWFEYLIYVLDIL